MNKFQVVGLAVALAVGTSFAQGSLWNPTAAYGIVYFDWIDECMNGPGSTFEEDNSEDPCYKDHGGWWFGYVAGPSSGGDAPECGPLSKKSSELNSVKAKIDGNWVTFVGPDGAPSNCEGPAITDIENGTSLLDDALEIEFSIGNGEKIPASDIYEPDIAALAVNLSYADSYAGKSPEVPRDFSGKPGFCLTYESNHSTFSEPDEGLGIELGWLEDDASSTNKIPYDVWHTKIPAGTGKITANFPWKPWGDVTGETGVFRQEGWSGTGKWPLSTAIGQMRSVKIRLKGYEETKVNFKLYEFGWAGECDGGTPPVSIAVGAKAIVNFSMVGRTINMLVAKPATVQVINLQGKVVHTQTLTPTSQKMNLSNLPTGVYMLRAPSLGYTDKIVLK